MWLKKLPSSSLQPQEISSEKSSVKVSQLEVEFSGHPDKNFVKYLTEGFRNGFDTGLNILPQVSFECDNLRSAKNDPEATTELLQTELERWYIMGPFVSVPFDTHRISPLGIAIGKYLGKKRLILDLSAPHQNEEHQSLNELIDKEEFSLSYATIDNAIKKIKALGQNSWMCKVDVRDAFKLVPIKVSLWPYYGIKWNGKFYFYTRLVFGSRSSPKIFYSLSEAVCWILQNNYDIQHLLHLLDDFLTIDPPDSLPDRTMAILTLVFRKLGIPLSTHKTVLEYLGIILDSCRMEARLPSDKIQRISEILNTFMNKKSCTKQELLSLLGHLNFACRVIYPGLSWSSICFIPDFLVDYSQGPSLPH